MANRICACLVTAALSLQSGRAAVAEFSELDLSKSESRPLIERFAADRGNITRYYNITSAPERRARLRKFYKDVQAAQAAQNFDVMGQDGRIDYILLRNDVDHELRRLDLEEKEDAENAMYLPFSATIVGLEEARRHMNPVDAKKSAETLTQLNKALESARRSIESELRSDTSPEAMRKRKIVGNRAALEAVSLRNTLRNWFMFYNAYDPMFTWWDEEAYRTVDTTLNAYTAFLRERVAGLRPAASEGLVAPPNPAAPGAGAAGAGRPGGNRAAVNSMNPAASGARAGSTDDIVGNPIGREGLMIELAYEMVPYTPEQLIAIANREFAWCEAEMKKASNQMGFGDDWKKALEKIKTMYVEPGQAAATGARSGAWRRRSFWTTTTLLPCPRLRVRHGEWR